MTPDAPATEPLGAECRVFCRYLADQEPSPYVVNCYQRAWLSTLPAELPLAFIDRGSLAIARWGTLPARIADAYTRVFRPYGPLRRRLILLLAILENSPPTDRPLNAAREGSRPAIMTGMLLNLLAGGVCLLAGIVLLGPLHLTTKLGGKIP